MQNQKLAEKSSQAATMLDDTTGLTVQEELFCKNIAAGMNNAAACRSAGYVGSRPTLTVKGSVLLRVPAIAQRIDDLLSAATRRSAESHHNGEAALERRIDSIQSRLVSQGVCSLETHLAQLALIRDGAILDRKWRDATDAEVKRGEVVGLYDRRSSSANDIAARLSALDKDASQTALKVALAKLHEHSDALTELQAKANAETIDVTPEND